GEPRWIIKRATVDAADVWESLERYIQLRRAYRTRMKVKKFPAAFRQMGVDGWCSPRNAYLIHMNYRLNHKSSTRCPLAEPAMADRDTHRLSMGPVAHRTTKASSLMAVHGRGSHICRSGRISCMFAC